MVAQCQVMYWKDIPNIVKVLEAARSGEYLAARVHGEMSV